MIRQITLNPSSVTLYKNHSMYLNATVIPASTSSSKMKWSSSKSNVVAVNPSTGLITALEKGDAIITVESKEDSTVNASCTVTVEVLAESIEIEPNNVTIGPGQEVLLAGIVSPDDADDRSVTWESSDTSIANIVPHGYDMETYSDYVSVFGRNNGTATITATANDGSGVKATCTVKVEGPQVVRQITVNPSNLVLEVDKSYPLDVDLVPSSISKSRVKWSSSNSNVVSVSESDGIITALAKGEATITARAKDLGGKKATCKVIVDDREKVTVKRDGDFNKIVFNSNGKVWYCINTDLINAWGVLHPNAIDVLNDRLYKNTYRNIQKEGDLIFADDPITYTDDEIKLFYFIDPHGLAAYIQEYARHVYGTNLREMVEFKDSVFKTLFNRDPKYFSRNKAGEWEDVTDEKDDLEITRIVSESESIFGFHQIYDYVTVKQMINIFIQILTLPVSFASLMNISVPMGYILYLKFYNLVFTLTTSIIEEDYETYIETVINELEGDSEDAEETKSENYQIDWAKQLFELSDEFGELADLVSDKPNFYKEIFDYCANNPSFRIYFEYNNGTVEEVYDISQKLNEI